MTAPHQPAQFKMRVIEQATAEAYLRERNRIGPAEAVEIRRLSGGVSNEVLHVGFAGDPSRDFVFKQARPRLRVADEWFCSVERTQREVEVLRLCEQVLSGDDDAAGFHIRTPRILFEDRENYCFTMQAAPAEHRVWKEVLLDGETDERIAAACGRLMAALHGRTWQDAEIARRLDDRQVFDELRLDPYYRTTAARRPEAAAWFNSLVESVWNNRCCLVHADFSPKNLLVYPNGMMMVDFETGHFGDPAFDIGFFLSHLVLKAFYHAPRHEEMLHLADEYWAVYAGEMQATAGCDAWSGLAARGMQNLAGCAWSRLDGKSPVEYLTDNRRREDVRAFCESIMKEQPASWPEARQFVRPG